MRTESKLLFFTYLISEVYLYSQGTSNNSTFICHNKTKPKNFADFINEEQFCDGHDHCYDGEDEHFGCRREGNQICGKGKFACDGGQCKNITVRCNTIKDCNDGTDELSCGDEIDVKNCTGRGKFLCKDGLRCLGSEFTCDKQCNCFDCSDEDENCSKYEDFVLLYANENEIKSINSTSFKSSSIARGIENCTLLTAANDNVYYATLSNDNKGRIFKIAPNSSEPEKLIETDSAITSLAVDFITNNVYYTSNGSLLVCTSDGRICAQLKCCNVDFVTLAPKYGWMYYMQNDFDSGNINCLGQSYLERSNMDGSNVFTRMDHCTKVEIPIEMDESTNEINYLSYDGRRMYLYRMKVDSAIEDLKSLDFVSLQNTYIRHFSYYNDEIFYTLNGTSGIFHAKNVTHPYDLLTRTLVYLNDSSTSNVTDIYVYNSALQRSDENPCEKALCPGICLIKPETQSSENTLSYTCFSNDSTPNNHVSKKRHSYLTFVWAIACVSVVIVVLCITAYFVHRKLH